MNNLPNDFAQLLIAKARTLDADEDLGLELKVYAFDSTTIDLCWSLFPRAVFRQRQGAVKLHIFTSLFRWAFIVPAGRRIPVS